MTNFSESPTHLDTKSADDTDSVATALARKLLPVSGGPNNNIPRHGLRLPTNIWGNLIGNITASFNNSFAVSKPATSFHCVYIYNNINNVYKLIKYVWLYDLTLTLGLHDTMAPFNWFSNLFSFLSSSSSSLSSSLFLFESFNFFSSVDVLI